MSSIQNISENAVDFVGSGWKNFNPQYVLGKPYFEERVEQVSSEYLRDIKGGSNPSNLESAVFAIDLIKVTRKGYKFIPSAPTLIAEAVNSIFVAMMSFVCAYENYISIGKARSIGDKHGEKSAQASFALNSIAFGAEASYFPMVGLGFREAGKYFSFHPAAAALFANSIAIATLPLYTFKTINNGIEFEGARIFSKELHAILDDAETSTERLKGALGYLFDKLTLSDEEFNLACQTGLQNPVDEADLKYEFKESVEKFLRENRIFHGNPDREKILNGILVQISKATKLKEKELKRLIGGDGVAIISHEKKKTLFKNLHFLLGVGSEKEKVEPIVRGILNEILRENQIIKLKKAGYISAGAIGITLTILSLFHFGSFPMAALGMSLTLLALDMHSLYRSYATKDVDFLKSIAMFVSTVFVLGIAASSLVLAPHIVGAIVCIAILILWTAARMKYQITAE